MTDAERLALATQVEVVFSLESAIEEAYAAIQDLPPHFSDDGLDYMAAAANVYVELIDIYRSHYEGGQKEAYIAWLAQPPYEHWGATDGDLRWWLADLIADDHPVIAALWSELVEHIFD